MNRTVMLIVTWDTIGFSTEPGKVFPFSVDLINFCRLFVVESNTTINFYIGHDVININEVHSIIKRNSLLEVLLEF